MQLSVIIVNYNVCYFLQQCLLSVMEASEGLAVEIIVVDNASSDESRLVLTAGFPSVHFIWNTSNIGFGRANNLAIASATGDYIVLLNPDTLVPQDIFTSCLQFFSTHPSAGGVGMRMFDGQGHYLPESKRGWPGTFTAFCKLIGLAKIFPRHSRLARYYLGHLSPTEQHPVEVLAGAFMVVPKTVIDRTGGFDPKFFMYGEDIDLSYRISQLGQSNYYLPLPGLIHFKGESTVRNSVQTRHFYEAMQIFVQKHGTGGFGNGLMRMAISGFAMVAQVWQRILPSKTPRQHQHWQLHGDALVIASLRPLLPPELSINGQAKALIYALGKDFKLQQVLENWIKDGAPPACMFYFCGADALIGSANKNDRGRVILLKKSPLV
jgi:N-acetylglucosaminyl-diphospho-decaprenol L-rhamnosyltransferase